MVLMKVVNHGVPLELLKRMRQLMAEYYHGKPVEEKLPYSHENHVLQKDGLLPPEGYASRYSKGFPLNWKDQFLHYTYPPSRRNPSLWPSDPPQYRYGAYNSLVVILDVHFSCNIWVILT
jgi:hypothetical protein